MKMLEDRAKTSPIILSEDIPMMIFHFHHPNIKMIPKKKIVLVRTIQQSLQGQDAKYNECLDLEDDDHA